MTGSGPFLERKEFCRGGHEISLQLSQTGQKWMTESPWLQGNSRRLFLPISVSTPQFSVIVVQAIFTHPPLSFCNTRSERPKRTAVLTKLAICLLCSLKDYLIFLLQLGCYAQIWLLPVEWKMKRDDGFRFLEAFFPDIPHTYGEVMSACQFPPVIPGVGLND